jgi:guanylate kinase
MLIQKHEDILAFSVSYTSRSARTGEKAGVDYYFVTKDEFESGIKDGIYLEWARVHSNYYGTARSEVERIKASGKNCILDIDVQGGLQIMESSPEALFIFIGPPDIQTLRTRLLERSTESLEVIEQRVARAAEEVNFKDRYDFIVTNNTLEKAYDNLERIILDEACINDCN